MSMKVLSLLECPFCQDQIGEIAVDADGLADARATRAADQHLDIYEEPDQKLLVFNSNRADPGPCEHLVDIYGSVGWGPKKDSGMVRYNWGLGFNWLWPEMKKRDPDKVAYGFMVDSALQHNTVPELMPRMPFHQVMFERVWTDCTDTDTPRRAYMAEGGAVFAKDRTRFFNELLTLAAKEEIWSKEGRPCFIDQQYEDEDDCDYEYVELDEYGEGEEYEDSPHRAERRQHGRPIPRTTEGQEATRPVRTSSRTRRVSPKLCSSVKPRSQHSLHDFLCFLDVNRDLEYVFYARAGLDDAVDAFGPSEKAARRLLGILDSPGRSAEPNREAPDTEVSRARRLWTQREVRSRVNNLNRRSGLELSLAWRLESSPAVYLEYSRPFSRADALAELHDLLEFHTEDTRP